MCSFKQACQLKCMPAEFVWTAGYTKGPPTPSHKQKHKHTQCSLLTFDNGACCIVVDFFLRGVGLYDFVEHVQLSLKNGQVRSSVSYRSSWVDRRPAQRSIQAGSARDPHPTTERHVCTAQHSTSAPMDKVVVSRVRKLFDVARYRSV